jgi:hypothetical protein
MKETDIGIGERSSLLVGPLPICTSELVEELNVLQHCFPVETIGLHDPLDQSPADRVKHSVLMVGLGESLKVVLGSGIQRDEARSSTAPLEDELETHGE